MSVPNGSVFRLMLNGAARNATFRGAHTEATGQAALANPRRARRHQPDAERHAQRRSTGAADLDAGSYTPAALALAVNERLEGGYARLAAGGELVIGTDRRGHSGRVQVAQNAAFGFTADGGSAARRSTPTNNNLPDLANFNAADLERGARGADSRGQRAALTGGRLVISTAALGETQTLAVADASDPAAGVVVRAWLRSGSRCPAPGDPPARGSNVRLFRKEAAANGATPPTSWRCRMAATSSAT